jgi:signal peptidase
MSRVIFDSDDVGQLRVEGSSNDLNSKTLITISSPTGQRSVVVTPTQIYEAKSKDYVQAPPERITPANQATKKRIALVFTFLGYIMIAILATFVVLSATGMMQARIVLTGSMAPTINAGDIVILNPSKTIAVQKDDIVTYTGRRFDGAAVGSFTHRIVGGDMETGFILKGDGNLNPDTQRVKRVDVIGKVVFVLPYIGQFLTPKHLFTLIPFIFILWLVIDRIKND